MQTGSPDLELGVALPDRIGGTPLIRLDKSVQGLEGITSLAKAERHAVIVTVLPGSADEYLSERFWEQA